jgi:hypothetical protein
MATQQVHHHASSLVHSKYDPLRSTLVQRTWNGHAHRLGRKSRLRSRNTMPHRHRGNLRLDNPAAQSWSLEGLSYCFDQSDIEDVINMHFKYLGPDIKSTLIPWLNGDGRAVNFTPRTIPSSTIPQGVGYPNGRVMSSMPYGFNGFGYQQPSMHPFCSS